MSTLWGFFVRPIRQKSGRFLACGEFRRFLSAITQRAPHTVTNLINSTLGKTHVRDAIDLFAARV